MVLAAGCAKPNGQAVEQGLELRAKLPFKFCDFPGYKHVTTVAGAEDVDTSVDKHVRVWHFGVAGELAAPAPTGDLSAPVTESYHIGQLALFPD